MHVPSARPLPAALAAAVLSWSAAPAGAGLIYTEDFEDDAGFVTDVDQHSDGAADFYGRVGPGGISVGADYRIAGVVGDSYFAGQDLDGDGFTNPATLTIAGIDIAGVTDLSFTGLFAEDDASDGGEDADGPGISDDLLHLDYSIDGGAFRPLVWFENDGSDFNSPFFRDADFDGVGEGAELTDTLAAFTAAIAGTGSTLDLRFTAQLDLADEDFAIDQFQIFGNAAAAPEPGSAALLLTAALWGIAGRRRRAV